MYLPRSKYTVTIAKPGEYVSLSGERYVGPVVTTYLGKSYAGKSPVDAGKELIRVSSESGSISTPRKTTVIRRIPTEQEYKAGSMERYFQQDLGTMKIVELLPEAFEISASQADSSKKYFAIPWRLTGSLDDMTVNGTYQSPQIVRGVRYINQTYIDSAEKALPGIISSRVLWNPEEFVRES